MPSRNHTRKNPRNRSNGPPGPDSSSSTNRSSVDNGSAAAEALVSQPVESATGPDPESSSALTAGRPKELIASGVPEDVANLLSELLTRQHHWQQKQAQSEQLIARLADQLDQSQRMIDSLVGNNFGSEAGQEGSQAIAPDEEQEEPFCWEQQKRLLLESDSPSSPRAVATVERLPARPPQDAKAKAAATCPQSLSLESRIEHEMGLLGESKEAERIRWLRERLEERLRESEIEISIERARLIRERRELEERLSEFAAEVARLRDDEKISRHRRNGGAGNGNRWKRFLGR